MNQFLATFVGLIAICNAQVALPYGYPNYYADAYSGYYPGAYPGALADLPGFLGALGSIALPGILRSGLPAVAPYAPGVVPAPISPVAPVVPTVIPATELNDWETYKAKFGKPYVGIEDLYHFGIYFANKEKVAKYDELIYFGLGTEKLVLDSFANFTHDELLQLRALEETIQDEWDSYKAEHKKVYDDFADKFHKTVYLIMKDVIEANNKMFDAGFIPLKMEINEFTDLFHYELPSPAPVLPSAGAVRRIPFLQIE